MRNSLYILSILALTSGCSDVCKNTFLKKFPSADWQHIAYLYQRDCGATTGFSSQVSILETDSTQAEATNAFVADDNHGAAAVGDWGGPRVEMHWVSPYKLNIGYADKSRIFEQKTKIGNVSIEYEKILAKSNK